MNKYTMFRKINENLVVIASVVPLSFQNRNRGLARDRLRHFLYRVYVKLESADNEKFFKK